MARPSKEMAQLNEHGIPKRIACKIMPVTESGCWIWLGSQLGRDRSRYGSVWFHGRNRAVHRVIYEIFKGEIGDSLVLDHLCRVTLCCNPDHIEPVDNRTNILRGVGAAAVAAKAIRCRNGHDFSGDNLRVYKGGRKCIICTREQGRRAYHKSAVRKRASYLRASPDVLKWREQQEGL